MKSQIKSQNLFAEIDKLILKYAWKCRGPRRTKTPLKKNSAAGIIILDFKTY